MKSFTQVKLEVTGINDGTRSIRTGEWDACCPYGEYGALRRSAAMGERHFWAKRGMEVPPTWRDRVLPRERDDI
jgi:hypothetical protein